MRRADVTARCRGADAQSLSAVGGLVAFDGFPQGERFGAQLAWRFGHLKQGWRVVYPMHPQLQLPIELAVVGAHRVFDLEWLALDPFLVHLAGGAVPSVEVLYDGLRRLEPDEREALEDLVAEQGLFQRRERGLCSVTLDIDSTVEPLFGEQEGALPGYNPHFHGRPCYHPLLARVAETDTVIGARLRPGDATLGEADVDDIAPSVDRGRAAAPGALVTARIDSAGDGAVILGASHRRGAARSRAPHGTARRWPGASDGVVAAGATSAPEALRRAGPECAPGRTIRASG